MHQKKNNKNIREIDIMPNLSTFEDEKTGVQSVGFTLQFPSGVNGFLVITKLKKGSWAVEQDLKKITLEFNEN